MNTYMKAFAVAALVAAVAASAEEANLYECKSGVNGVGVEVGYTTTSFDGQPTFQLQEKSGPLPVAPIKGLSKSGDEIRVVHAAPGNLVTVHDDRTVIMDGPSYSYTLVLPHVNLSDELPVAAFDTMLIRTRHANTIGGPGLVKGAIEDSTYTPVSCEARAVQF